MGSLRSHKPTPALIISIMALLVALGGTGYAALGIPNGSVGTAQLRNGAITTKKLQNGAVTAAKIDCAEAHRCERAARKGGYQRDHGQRRRHARERSDGTGDMVRERLGRGRERRLCRNGDHVPCPSGAAAYWRSTTSSSTIRSPPAVPETRRTLGLRPAICACSRAGRSTPARCAASRTRPIAPSTAPSGLAPAFT